MTTKSKMTKQTLKTMEKITGQKLTLGTLIYSIRLGEEMTQTEFAKLLDMSKSHLCDLEHGRKLVSPGLAAQYANKLGYDEEQFIRLALQASIDKAGLNYDVELGVRMKKTIIKQNKKVAYSTTVAR
jgi:transcriptional regulator with XRE-family HTH domain